MCGIISYFSNSKVYNKDIYDLLKSLVKVGSIRGEHSTGLLVDEGTGYMPTIVKKAVPGYEFLEDKEARDCLYNYEKTRYIIGHNRFATMGAHTDENAHPFVFGNITGVHNGTIHNPYELSTNYLNVDSEHIFDALSMADSRQVIPKIEGAFNLLWNDALADTVHMVRNSERPYALAYAGKPHEKEASIIVGASELNMLRWLLGRNGFKIFKELEPEEGKEYVFDATDFLKEPEIIEHKLAPVKTYYYGGYNNHYNYGGRKKNKPKYSKNNSQGYAVSIGLDFYLDRFEQSKKDSLKGDYWGKTIDNKTVVIKNVMKQNWKEDGQWYSGNTCWKDLTPDIYYISHRTIKAIDDEDVLGEKVVPFSKQPLDYVEEKKRSHTYIDGRDSVLDDRPDTVTCSICQEEQWPPAVVYEDGEPMCADCLVIHKY